MPFQRQRYFSKDKDEPKMYQRQKLWEKMSKMQIPKTKTPKTSWMFSWCILQDIYCIDIVSTTTGFYLFDTLVIMHHICRIDIVSNTSEFYAFDNPLMMSYIPVYLFYWYCECRVGIICVLQPHRDELYCMTFIVLILWALQQGFIYLTPWLYCIIFVVSILWDINSI